LVVDKIREGLIHNAKVKRAYYRTLKREEKAGNLAPRIPLEDAEVFSSRKDVYMQELGTADLNTLHPSRSQALTQSGENQSPQQSGSTKKGARRLVTKAERAALAEEKRREEERNQKEREKKILQRERKRRELRKMTDKGQPVMKTRIKDLLQKVKKAVGE
jgi:rRNA processing